MSIDNIDDTNWPEEEGYVNPDEAAEVLNTVEFSKMPPAPVATPKPYSKYSSECKVEPASRLSSALVISFEQLVIVTKEGDPYQGAILIDLVTAAGEVKEQWLPKKLCSNLDLEDNTVCVWDVFMKARISDLGGLSYEPEYAGKTGDK